MAHRPNERFKSSKVQGFNRTLFGFLILILELLNPLNLEPIFAQANYYQGKTIRVIVGYQPGDSHDQWARGYTRYLGKYIPGNPNFLVQNMPGAGGMIAANYIYNIAKQDGLTMGTIGGALYFAQLIGRSEAKYDWNKFTWIGTPERSGFLVFMRTDAPYKTIEDIRTASEPPRCSATGVGSSGYDIPRVLEDTLGMKFKVISGYPGGADQDLAMERGEVHCRAFTIDAFFGREPFPTWMKKGFVRVVIQMERKRHPKLPGCPDDLGTHGSIQSAGIEKTLGCGVSEQRPVRFAADRLDTGPFGGTGENLAHRIYSHPQRSGFLG